MEISKAAFECAVLAAVAGEKSELWPEVARLGAYAIPRARIVGEWWVDVMGDPSWAEAALGPWGPVFTEVGPEFWIGVSFGEATKAIDTFLLGKVSYEGRSFDSVTAARSLEAEAEFRRRNCHLID